MFYAAFRNRTKDKSNSFLIRVPDDKIFFNIQFKNITYTGRLSVIKNLVIFNFEACLFLIWKILVKESFGSLRVGSDIAEFG